MAVVSSRNYTSMRVGVLPVRVEVLESALCLPDGYTIAGMEYEESMRTLKLIVSSDQLPEAQENSLLPMLNLWITVDQLPDNPEYRRYTSKVELGEY